MCTSLSEPLASVRWRVNGSSLVELGLDSVVQQGIFGTMGVLTFPSVPLEYNGTTVQCLATFPNGTLVSSNIAALVVQGIVVTTGRCDRVHYVIPYSLGIISRPHLRI